MKPIIPTPIGGDLRFVHFSNAGAFRMVNGPKPLQVGGVCKAEVRIVSAINANEPPSMPHASSPLGGLYIAPTLSHCHRQPRSKLLATLLAHARKTSWVFANSLHHPFANSVMSGYWRLFVVNTRHTKHFAYNSGQ